MPKIFIVSLPRTGTTSVCLYLLECGFNVAHTAYTQATFKQADVIADTPVFTDYPSLYHCYPDAKFVYLERPMDTWLPSIRRLLQTMRKQWIRDHTFFEEDIRRCFQHVFPEFFTKKDFKNSYIQTCFHKHRMEVLNFFADKKEQLLILNLGDPGAGKILRCFCGASMVGSRVGEDLPHVNKGRRIAYWQDIEHANKVSSYS